MLLNLLLLLLLPVLLSMISVVLPAAGHPCSCKGPCALPAWHPHCRACPWSVPFPTPPGSFSFFICLCPGSPQGLPFRRAMGCHISHRCGRNYWELMHKQAGRVARTRVPGEGRWVLQPRCTGDGVACACSEGLCQQPGDFSQRAQRLFYCLTALFSSSRQTPLSFNPRWGQVAEAILEAGGSSFKATCHLMGADISVSEAISAAVLPLPVES